MYKVIIQEHDCKTRSHNSKSRSVVSCILLQRHSWQFLSVTGFSGMRDTCMTNNWSQKQRKVEVNEQVSRQRGTLDQDDTNGLYTYDLTSWHFHVCQYVLTHFHQWYLLILIWYQIASIFNSLVQFAPLMTLLECTTVLIATSCP